MIIIQTKKSAEDINIHTDVQSIAMNAAEKEMRHIRITARFVRNMRNAFIAE